MSLVVGDRDGKHNDKSTNRYRVESSGRRDTESIGDDPEWNIQHAVTPNRTGEISAFEPFPLIAKYSVS